MIFIKEARHYDADGVAYHQGTVDMEQPPHAAKCTCGWRETGFPIPRPAIRVLRSHFRDVHGAGPAPVDCFPFLRVAS